MYMYLALRTRDVGLLSLGTPPPAPTYLYMYVYVIYVHCVQIMVNSIVLSHIVLEWLSNTCRPICWVWLLLYTTSVQTNFNYNCRFFIRCKEPTWNQTLYMCNETANQLWPVAFNVCQNCWSLFTCTKKMYLLLLLWLCHLRDLIK